MSKRSVGLYGYAGLNDILGKITMKKSVVIFSAVLAFIAISAFYYLFGRSDEHTEWMLDQNRNMLMLPAVALIAINVFAAYYIFSPRRRLVGALLGMILGLGTFYLSDRSKIDPTWTSILIAKVEKAAPQHFQLQKIYEYKKNHQWSEMSDALEYVKAPLRTERLTIMNMALNAMPDDLERKAEFKQWVKSGYVGHLVYKEFMQSLADYDGELSKEQSAMVISLIKS